MKPCPQCPIYSTCTELCAEAEAYVSQDRIPRHEPFVDDKQGEQEDGWHERNLPPKGDKTLITQMYLDGLNSYQIAYHLGCSRQYIDRVIATNEVNKRAEIIRKKPIKVI